MNIRMEKWKTTCDVGKESKWETTVIFVPEGMQIVKSKFTKLEYDKFHKKPLGYKCKYVLELVKED